MRHSIIFPGEFLALISTEAVLFVDDDISKCLNLLCLNKRMRADENRNFAISNPFQKLGAGNIGRTLRIYF
jgi:hypothetical protein